METKPTNCHFCGYLCAFNATVDEGRIIDLQPDPTRYPYDSKVLAGCRRWRCNLDTLDGTDRVNYPLRRVGERGSGEFERVSWDEVLDDIAARLMELACEHGPETLASMIGGPHTSFWPLHRFMNLFGSPNNMGIGQICWNPRIWMDVVTFGWTIEADIRSGITDCLVIWGTNPAQSDNSAFWQHIRGIARTNAELLADDVDLSANMGAGSLRGGSCQGRGSSRPPQPCHPLADDVSGVADKCPEESPIPPMECQREASECPDSARRATERTSVRDESRTRVEDGCSGVSQRQLSPPVPPGPAELDQRGGSCQGRGSSRPPQPCHPLADDVSGVADQRGGSCQAGGRLLRQSSLGGTAHWAVPVAAELASDPHASHPPADSMDLGAGDFSEGYVPIVVVDPLYTQTASLADIWVPIKPGTDVAFALGLLNVLIAEDLVDHAFVDEWCYGFDELARAVRDYPPARVAQICDIDEALVVRVARLWGNARAGALVSGRGVDQTGRNVAPTHRAICCLRAVRGFVDAPGTMIIQEGSDFVSEYELELTAALASEHKARCLNTDFTPLQCYNGFDHMAQLTRRAGRELPERYLTSAHPDLVLRAMETGEPYPVRALIVEATNPLLTYADTHRVFKALMSLDLIVVLDYYLTSTAQIADYVLPSAAAMERATFQAHGGVANNVYGGPAAVEPYYERRNDFDIFRKLGLRLGQKGQWPWKSFEDAIAYTLEPAGMDFETYCQLGIYFQQPRPWKHEELDENGHAVGFATTTGKVELASVALDALGGPRVPALQPQISLCSPDLIARAEAQGGAHLQLITGARKQPYNASMYFNISQFRKQSPRAVAEMSESTAERLGLSAGDEVVLATDKGSARFILSTRAMRDDLVSADYGWWHPEWMPGAPDFGGIWESNINCLTSCDVANGEEMIGTWSYNAIDCVITKG